MPFQCSSTSRNCRNLVTGLAQTLEGRVSVLFNEPKLPKSHLRPEGIGGDPVSVLFNEPKLPKFLVRDRE